MEYKRVIVQDSCHNFGKYFLLSLFQEIVSTELGAKKQPELKRIVPPITQSTKEEANK